MYSALPIAILSIMGFHMPYPTPSAPNTEDFEKVLGKLFRVLFAVCPVRLKSQLGICFQLDKIGMDKPLNGLDISQGAGALNPSPVCSFPKSAIFFIYPGVIMLTMSLSTSVFSILSRFFEVCLLFMSNPDKLFMAKMLSTLSSLPNISLADISASKISPSFALIFKSSGASLLWISMLSNMSSVIF